MGPTARQAFTASLMINQTTYEVQSFSGREALNSPYCFKILFPSEAIILPEAVLGQTAQLTLENPVTGQRCIHGVVYAFNVRHADTKQLLMECEIRPRLSLLNFSGQARVYQDQTIETLIDTVLKSEGLAGSALYWRRGRRKYYKYPQWVQAENETDFEFFERALAREGINYLWDNLNASEDRISFVDESYDLPIAVYEPFYLQDRGGLTELDFHGFYDFSLKEGNSSYQLIYRDCDPLDTSRIIEKQVGTGKKQLTVWGWGAIDTDQLTQAATHHYQSLMMNQTVLSFLSHHPDLSAGHRIEARHLPSSIPDGKFSLLEVVHHYHNHHYHNRIQCIPQHMPVRPRPIISQASQLVHTAVIESENELPFLDQNTSYNYHTHTHNSNEGLVASQAARRLMPYGGPALKQAMGLHFPLKNQAEVLVMYLHNDFNQPVLQNSPANGLNHAPVTSTNPWSVLMKTAWGQYLELSDRQGFETLSMVNAEGRNYLRFEDQKGHEKISLAAEGGSVILASQNNKTLQSDASIHQEVLENYHLVSHHTGRITAKNLHFQALRQQIKVADVFEINADRHLEAKAENMSFDSGGEIQLIARGGWIQVNLPNGDMIWQAEDIELSSDKSLHLTNGSASIQLNEQGIFIEAQAVHFDSSDIHWKAPVGYAPEAVPALQQPAVDKAASPAAVPFYQHGFAKKISAPVWDKPFYYPGETAYIHLDIEGFNGDESLELHLVSYHHDDRNKPLPECPALEKLDKVEEKDKSSFQLGDSSLYMDKREANDSPGHARLRILYALNHLGQQENSQDDPYYIRAKVGDFNGKLYSNPMVIMNHVNIKIEADKDVSYKGRESVLWVKRALPDVLKSHPQCPSQRQMKFYTRPTRFEQLPLGDRNTVSLTESHQFREIFNEASPKPLYKQPFKVTAAQNAHTFKRLMPPIIFNLRSARMAEDKTIAFTDEEPHSRLMLKAEEVEYIKANGNNLTVFIHGYNVEYGQFNKHFEHCELVEFQHLRQSPGMAHPSMTHTMQIDSVLSEADATIFRDKDFIREQFPKLKAFQTIDTKENKVFDNEQLNGTGMHAWVTYIEDHLNKAAGFDGKDFSSFSRCMFIAWPGNPPNELDYISAVHESVRMGAIVAEVFRNLKKQIEGLKLHVITHSQGAGVMVHTLNELGKSKKETTKVDHVFLCQPAIPSNALSTYGIESMDSPLYESVAKQQTGNVWFCPFAHKAAERISVLHSKNDNILGPILEKENQPAGVNYKDVIARKPALEYFPALFIQAVGGKSIYFIANYVGCSTTQLLDTQGLEQAWQSLIKSYPEYTLHGRIYSCGKTLSIQLHDLAQQGIKDHIDHALLKEKVHASVNELRDNLAFQDPDSCSMLLPPMLLHFAGLAMLEKITSKEISKFISDYRHYIEYLSTLIISLYLLNGEKPKPAMGYEGVEYKDDKILMDKFNQGKLEKIDTTAWIWHHSDMKVGSKDIQENIYREKIIKSKQMVFGLFKKAFI